jgi:hypothetical protein
MLFLQFLPYTLQNSSKNHVTFIHSNVVCLRADRLSSTQGVSKRIILQNKGTEQHILAFAYFMYFMFQNNIVYYYSILEYQPSFITTHPLPLKQRPLHCSYFRYMGLEIT